MTMTLSAAIQAFREKWPGDYQPDFPEKLAELSQMTGRTITRAEWLAESQPRLKKSLSAPRLPASAFSASDAPPGPGR